MLPELSPIVIGLVELIIVWVTPSILLTLIIASLSRKQWDIVEFSSVATAVSILILPNVLRIEHHWRPVLQPYFIAINACLILVVALLFNWWRPLAAVFPTRTRTPLAKIWRRPWVWALAIVVGLTLVIMLTYKSLPDIDPYKWLKGYRAFRRHESIPGLTGRDSFYYLLYLLQTASHIEAYHFFKYVFPWLSLLYLPSAWLVARTLPTKVAQLVWLLIPVASASTWLYFQMMMPQTIVIILYFIFGSWLLYSQLSKDRWWYYAAGVMIFLSYPYHQASFLFFLPWLIITLITDTPRIWQWSQRNRLPASLVVVLVVSHLGLLTAMTDFFIHWSTQASHFHFGNFNWYFPAHYTNIDNQSVGWAGPSGVLKYYVFYAGLPALLLGVVGLVQLGRWRRPYFRQLPDRVTVILGLLTIGFVGLTELLPRLFSLALLPTRAWIFLGMLLFWVSLSSLRRWPRFNYVLLATIGISIIGAVYVNYLKQFYIPDYQYDSAVWLRQNLPAGSILLSSRHTYVLEGVGEKTFKVIPDDAYCSEALLNDENLAIYIWPNLNQILDQRRSLVLDQYFEDLHTYVLTKNPVALSDITDLTAPYVPQINQPLVAEAVAEVHELRPKIFVYYAQEDPRNPITNRPYTQAGDQPTCFKPTLDTYPQAVTKVYDDHGRVMIWQLR